jgi:hypothetical protein
VPEYSIATYRHKSAYIKSASRSHRTPSATLIALPDVDRVVRSHVMRNKVVETHPHTFRSRILHTGTLYPPLSPTLASVNNTHRRHIFTSACCQPHVSAQREKVRASLRRVCPRIFSDSRPTPLTVSLNYTATTNSTASVRIANTVLLEDSFRRCLTATANFFFLSPTHRDGGHQVCAPGYRYVY